MNEVYAALCRFMSGWRRSQILEATAIGIGPADGTFDAPPSSNWLPLDSDFAARMYRNDVQLLFNFGAGGAVRGIKSTMANFENGRSRGDVLSRASSGAAHVILQPIEQEIYNVLALALQGHFEKAYRRWLRNSLQFVGQDLITDDDIVKAQWSAPASPKRDLGAITAALRGIDLKNTPEGPLLLELALVGNVVRHGDGPSARKAYQQYPVLFDPVTDYGDGPIHAEDEELPERLRVTEERLALYAQAAFCFWHRVQFAYTGEA
jgi:hypothetical protein